MSDANIALPNIHYRRLCLTTRIQMASKVPYATRTQIQIQKQL